jgi:hypothetical protein
MFLEYDCHCHETGLMRVSFFQMSINGWEILFRIMEIQEFFSPVKLAAKTSGTNIYIFKGGP